MANAIVPARIVSFETRASKRSDYVSLTLDQNGTTFWASAFVAASVDGDAVTLPTTDGTATFTPGAQVRLTCKVSAYVNAKGVAYASYAVLSVEAGA